MPKPKQVACCLLLCLVSPSLFAAQADKRSYVRTESHLGSAIVCPDYPKDSRGETVYEVQGDDQKDEPVIQGTILPPSAIKMTPPKYPNSLKRERAEKQVTVKGVIAGNGDFIDARVVEAVEPDVAKAALDAVGRWKFHPGTLDGKPVAERTKVIVSFRIR